MCDWEQWRGDVLMRRLLKNIADPNVRKELDDIWNRINYVETKTVEPTVTNTAPGEIVIYNGSMYVNDRNTIRTIVVMSDAGEIDGVDLAAHAAGDAMTQHAGGVGTHSHRSDGMQGGMQMLRYSFMLMGN